MAISNSFSNLREWAPLTDLLGQIPSKPNLNIFSGEVKITCVDILPEFIALGTNYGMAYWYDRKTKDLKRLRCENSHIPVTAIKVLSTVDFMLACGSLSGNISIFQIPKVFPDWIPEKLKPKNKSVERYTVSELHKSAISALEWSKNGMKLFSGDKDGTVVLTEIDFYMHICKSLEILNESYEVAQLSYSNPKLVVSTTYRTIICEKSDKWNVMQVGRQDRKILGPFGALIQQDKLKPKEAVIYCTRPGLRLWVSDDQGVVQKTLVFKDILKKECAEVPLLNPVSKHLQLKPLKDVNFSVILPLGENLLVTYNSNEVYVLDVEKMILLAKISQLRRVLDVACHKDEIFILEEDRNLIRISTRPEIDYDNTNISPKDASFLPSSIKCMASKLQPSSVLSPIIGETFTTISEHTDDELIMNAEEALEATISPCDVKPQKRFDNIDIDDSSEILYKQKKHRRKKSEKDRNADSFVSSNDSSEENMSINKPTLMNMSTVGQLPDLRSPQSILTSIEQKEKLLAAFLTYDKKSESSVDNRDVNKGSSQISDAFIQDKDKMAVKTKKELFPVLQDHSNFTSGKLKDEQNPSVISSQTSKVEKNSFSDPFDNGKHNVFEPEKHKLKSENSFAVQNGQTQNSEQSHVNEPKSNPSIADNIDYCGLIDIDKILTLQESRTSEFKENFRSPHSKRKVMKKSHTSVMNDSVSFFDTDENHFSDRFDNLSISEYSNSSKMKHNDGVGTTRAIPIMSKSTEMPACIDIPNGWQVPSLERTNSCSDLLLKDWVIL